MTEDDKEFFIKMGARLAEFRKAQGLTQVALAERLGVSQQTVNSFEKGRRRVPVSALPELAGILDVTIEELIDPKKSGQPQKRGPASKLERQLEQIRLLPRSKQRFVIEMLDTVLAQAERAQT